MSMFKATVNPQMKNLKCVGRIAEKMYTWRILNFSSIDIVFSITKGSCYLQRLQLDIIKSSSYFVLKHAISGMEGRI